MAASWRDYIIKPFRNIVSVGNDPEMDFIEKKQIETTNIVLLISLPIVFYFMINNIIEMRGILVYMNLAVIISAILLLYLTRFRRLLMGRMIIYILFICLYSVQAVLYRSGTENFLYINLILALIFFAEKKVIYSMAILNCLAFVLVKYLLTTDFHYGSVPPGRAVFNAGWAMCISAAGLLFFKLQQANYLSQIEEKNNQLQLLNSTKEKLFSIIAHDLRSPIAQLKSSLDLLNRDFISEQEFRGFTEDINKQISNMQLNLDDLLIWSQSQMTGIKIMPKEISVNEVVGEVIDLLKPHSKTKNIQLKNHTSDIKVFIDPDHLKLALRNIISNAIKFSYPDGIIEISSISAADYVSISIKDFGMGMNQKTINLLFSESVNSMPGTAMEKGSGLGLRLCRDFLEKSDSTINITSEVGKGSTFQINIPVRSN